MGVHTGNSITVAPALTLTDKEYQIMRDASLAVLREIGVETGGSNVQFGVNPSRRPHGRDRDGAAGLDRSISRSTASEASRMIWYSLSVKVSAGATVMESPVCTPIGSRFSIEQMMMQLSFLSRTTSISNSFHPNTLSSIRTSSVGEASMPRSTISMNSALV